jgi:hypothetical protein
LIAKVPDHGGERVDLARVAVIGGRKIPDRGLKPGIAMPGAAKFWGSTTFAIRPVYTMTRSGPK